MSGAFFSDNHAMPDSQLSGLPCTVGDDPATAEARQGDSFASKKALAQALDFQLRYRESIGVYDALIAERPGDIQLIRTRAARYISTLQPRKAIGDLLMCRASGMEEGDIGYRLGIAYYLAGEYPGAMRETAGYFSRAADEMGIAAMYWHTLAAWRCGEQAELLGYYHPGMDVGHHTAYERVMALAAGVLPESSFLEILDAEASDLEYAMLAYGYARWLIQSGRDAETRQMLGTIVSRDGFWIAYGYLAAWNDLHPSDADR